jgi:hypothetical protein
MTTTISGCKPAFLITIDTEGDDLWSNPRVVHTRNAAFLPRFQTLCERHGFRPTYLTNFEMATASRYVEFARDALNRDVAEVGMHLHAWNSPPLLELTYSDRTAQPYLIEYSDEVMREKIRVMTGTLEETFGVKMVSHRAGRWTFDRRYMAMLLAEGYTVDCSVTPRVSWADCLGNPAGTGGTDYRMFPDSAYWLDAEDIARPAGKSRLLEVPMTILQRDTVFSGQFLPLVDGPDPWHAKVLRSAHSMIQRLALPPVWLRPRGDNLQEMLWIAERVIDGGRDYAEFMLHSSELMPGGGPTFRTERDIERLYEHLETLFSWMASRFVGMTLAAYKDRFARGTALALLPDETSREEALVMGQ